MLTKLLISNKPVSIQNAILKILTDLNLSKSSLDVLYFEANSKFGVDEAKQVISFFTLKPYSSNSKVVTVENADVMTTDAQNMLLKTIEEPPQQGLIILGSHSNNTLLPTILSRCEIVDLMDFEPLQIDPSIESDILKLNELDPQSRFEYIEKVKDKHQFFIDLIVTFRNNLLKNPNKQNQILAKNLLIAEEWKTHNGNIRAILEYLMLVLPRK